MSGGGPGGTANFRFEISEQARAKSRRDAVPIEYFGTAGGPAFVIPHFRY